MTAPSARSRFTAAAVLASVLLATFTACTDTPTSRVPAGPTAGAPSSPTDPGTAVLLAAGDVARCDSSGDEATADLLDRTEGTIAVLGDSVYERGMRSEYNRCYAPSWGRHKARTRPAPGNHEYRTPGAVGYFGYFGRAAGDPARGYYSYNLGSWHIVVLNSNCWAVLGCGAGSPQEKWLRGDLASSPHRCTLAYWHHPLFTSDSQHPPATEMRPLVRALHDAGAEVILSGHSHTYERFAPQNADGARDDAAGIRAFVVGTGGASLYRFGAIHSNSEVRNADTYGVLKLTLRSGAYEWQFLPVAGKTFTDSGAGTCH